MGENLYPFRKVVLRPPPLQEVAKILHKGLKYNFENVNVQVVQCPDLKKEPFNLAGGGLCGNPAVADIGGPPYLVPMVQMEKKYAIEKIVQLMNYEEKAFAIGAACGPAHIVGVNCELMPNISFKINGNSVSVDVNETHFAKIIENGSYKLEKINASEFLLLGNLFVSNGEPGPVIQINAEKRIGSDNFVSSIRKVLADHYGSRTLSAGGVFLLKSGEAKMHVMPDFSKTPLNTESDVNEWLQFFTMKSPLVCLSVFHSHDPELDLRIEHTHCFSGHNDGGHYHYDTTPDTVSYECYINLANQLYRIDAPEVTHSIGRD